MLTVNADALAGRSLAAIMLHLRRQAEPSAVLLHGRYAEHRGLWNLWERPKFFDGLASLRPSESNGTEVEFVKLK